MILCPVCSQEFKSGRTASGHSASSNIKEHLVKMHGLSRNEAHELLLRRGIIKEGLIITDQAIADWNAKVAAGVFE